MGDDDKNLSHARYSRQTHGNLVPDDSWYVGLALRLWIRSKALNIREILQFKDFFLNAWKFCSKKRRVCFQLWSANLVFALIKVHQNQSFGCACLKRKCRLLVEERIANIGIPLEVYFNFLLLFWWTFAFLNYFGLLGLCEPAYYVGVSDRWQVTGDMQHATCDTWHMTYDIWHMTSDTSHFLLFFSFLSISVHFGIGATFCTRQEIPCLPYAGFLYLKWILQSLWRIHNISQISRHNGFNPLWLPCNCSPDLYNVKLLHTSQKRFYSAEMKNIVDNFSESYR